MIFERQAVLDLILKIENEVMVNKWKYQNYHLWPLMRLFLSHALIEDKKNWKRYKPNKFKKLTNLLYDLVVFPINYIKLRRSVDNIYVGARTYCTLHNGKYYNKYFDIEMDNCDGSSIYINQGESYLNAYKPNRHRNFNFYLKMFRFLKSKTLKKEIKSILDSVFSELSPYLTVSKDDLALLKVKCLNFLVTTESARIFYSMIFKKLEPTQVKVLCYYSSPTLGLLLAANKLGISTFDMQHGSVDYTNVKYSSWTSIPSSGYESLPNAFLLWDDHAFNIVNAWTNEVSGHKAILAGNPWVEMWRNGILSPTNTSYPDNIILLTLQPVDPIIDDYLVEIIKKTSNNYNWWIRLHPRQLKLKNEVVKFLHNNSLTNIVEIELATSNPLPEILANTKVHITKFSGCAVEASQMNVPTIIIDEIGSKLLRDEDPTKYLYFKKDYGLIEVIKKISN